MWNIAFFCHISVFFFSFTQGKLLNGSCFKGDLGTKLKFSARRCVYANFFSVGPSPWGSREGGVWGVTPSRTFQEFFDFSRKLTIISIFWHQSIRLDALITNSRLF